MSNKLDSKELACLLKMVRARLDELDHGLHRYFLNRRIKSADWEELLPKLKKEQAMMTNIRNKLWRKKRDAKHSS